MDTWDKEWLYDDVSRGTPGRLPWSNVDVDEVQLQVEVVDLRGRGEGRGKGERERGGEREREGERGEGGREEGGGGRGSGGGGKSLEFYITSLQYTCSTGLEPLPSHNNSANGHSLQILQEADALLTVPTPPILTLPSVYLAWLQILSPNVIVIPCRRGWPG